MSLSAPESGSAERILAAAFHQHTERLLGIVHFRMDGRLRSRVDPEDVLQEAYLDAIKRIENCDLDNPERTFVWLRLISLQTLTNVHRRHLGVQKRSTERQLEILDALADSFFQPLEPSASLTSPSQAMMREETMSQIQRALADLPELHREILLLRHFEGLSNTEVAAVLNIGAKAASSRYVRAIERLRQAAGASEDIRSA